jgi:antitoxin CptB
MHEEKKLKWMCRRGMLELDLLLTRYLEKSYYTDTRAMQKAFIKLLNCEDPEIFSYLTGRVAPDDVTLKEIVDAIRALKP